MARSSECTEQYAQKVLDTADIVRDAIYQQLPPRVSFTSAAGSPIHLGEYNRNP